MGWVCMKQQIRRHTHFVTSVSQFDGWYLFFFLTQQNHQNKNVKLDMNCLYSKSNSVFDESPKNHIYTYIYIWIYNLIFAQIHLNCWGGGPKILPLCLLAVLEGANPSIFWIFCNQ